MTALPSSSAASRSGSSGSSSIAHPSSSSPSPTYICTNHTGPSVAHNYSDLTLIPTPFNTQPVVLEDFSLAFLSCDSSSYVVLYSLLYTPSFYPFSSTSPYLFSVQTAFNFSLAPYSCPAQLQFNLSSPLSMDASHTLGIYISQGTVPDLIYTAGLSSFAFDPSPEPPLLPLSSTLTPSHYVLTNFSLLTSSSVLSVAVQCPAGQHVLVAAQEVCTSCAAGLYISSGSTFLDCFDCPPGTWSAAGAATCTPCSAGFYQPNWATASCVSCPAGFTSTPGNSTCAPCAVGSYAGAAGSGQCSLCPQGFYSGSEGVSHCTACPVLNGTVTTTAGNGSTSASQCSIAVTYCADHAPLCGHNQTCLDSNVPGSFSCECAQGWTGVNCSSPLLPSPSSSTAASLSSSVYSSSWMTSSSDDSSGVTSAALLMTSASSSSTLPSVSMGSMSSSSLLFSSSSSVFVTSSSSAVFNASCPCANASHCVRNSTSWSCDCPVGFAGALCNRCEPGYYSPRCLPCQGNCTNGRWSDGVAGDGSCVCDAHFAGPSCDACAAGYWGGNCTACNCQHGSCDQGLAGTGVCTCASDWAGLWCDLAAAEVVTPNLPQPPIYLPPGQSSFILVQLNGLSSPTSTFYSRIDRLPSYSNLWQTNDGITPLTLISAAYTPVTDKVNRVLWQPPLDWQGGVADNFTFSIGMVGVGFSQSPGTVTLTVLAPPSPPVISAPDTLLKVEVGGQLSLSTVWVEDGSRDELQLRLSARTGRVSVADCYLPGFNASAVNASANWSSLAASAPATNLTLRGDAAFLNAALSTLTYYAAVNVTGLDLVTVMASNDNTSPLLMPPTSSSAIRLSVHLPRRPPSVSLSATSFLVNEYARVRVPAMTAAHPQVDVDLLTCALSCSHCTLALDVVTVPIYDLLFPSSRAVTSGASLVFSASLPRLNLLLANLSYTPTFGYVGQDPISVNVSLDGLTRSVVVTANVSHVNRPGVATNLQVSLVEDTRVWLALNSTSLDEDASAFTYVVATPPPVSCGQLYQADAAQALDATPITAVNTTVTDPLHRVQFVPAPYQWGSPMCNFSYFAHDAANKSETFTSSAVVSFYVSHVNHAPTVSSSQVYGYQNEDLLVTLQAVDPDSDALSYYIDALPTTGSLYQFNAKGPRGALISLGEQLTDALGRLIYAPLYNASGDGGVFDSLGFSVSDGQEMAGNALVDVYVGVRVTPVPYDWTVATNVDADVQLTFAPAPSQLGAFTVSQVVISAPAFPVLWSLYSPDPVTGDPLYCALPCTVVSVNGSAPSIIFSPAPQTTGTETLSYQSYNGPVYTDVNTPNQVSIDVVAVTTTAAPGPDVEWCGAVSLQTLWVVVSGQHNRTSVQGVQVRIDSLPSDLVGYLHHHDASVGHSGGVTITVVPVNLTTDDTSVDWVPNFSPQLPWATSFTYSLATAPLYLFSPPATARLYSSPSCDFLPEVTAQDLSAVVEGDAVTIALTGDGFDAWTVNVTSLPHYGALYQANGAPITNATAVTDPLRRVIYQAPLVRYHGLLDNFTVQGVSIKGNAGVPATINVSVVPGNSPPVAVSGWYLTNENAPLLLTLQGWDAESNDTLDAVILSLPALGYLYVCINGSSMLNELIYTTPFTLSAAQGYEGRAQVWFAAEALTYSQHAITDVYASFQYQLVDTLGLRSLPATVSLVVDEVDVGPSVADIQVAVPPVTRSLIALSGEGDNAAWWAVVLTLPAGTLLQVEDDGTMGSAITTVPAVVSNLQHLLLYEPCAACGANDTFMYAAQSTSTIAYSNVTVGNNASSSSSSSTGSGSRYTITSSPTSPLPSTQSATSSAVNGSDTSSAIGSGVGFNSSSGALSSSPVTSSPTSTSGASGSSGDALPEAASSSGSSSGGLDPTGEATSALSSSALSGSTGGSGFASSSGTGASPNSSFSSSSFNGTGNSTVNASSSVPYVPRHYTPVIANLSATATATLLFSAPLPPPFVNVTYTLNQSTMLDIPLPVPAMLTQLPWHGFLQHVCISINASQCNITDTSGITQVPTVLQGNGVRYSAPTSATSTYLYGLQVNSWVLDYFLYVTLPSPTAAEEPLSGLPASPALLSTQTARQVSLAVVDVLQPPTALPAIVSDISENGVGIIELQYLSESDASTLHAHVVELPQHGRLCQLVNGSQCGEVMYPPVGNASTDAVDVVVVDPSFNVVYVPEENWSGVDYFTWEMQDSFGRSKNQANVTLNVKHVNQPPVPFDLTLTLSPTSATLYITLNATDPDQDSATLTYWLRTPLRIGSLSQTFWSDSRLGWVTEAVQVGVPLQNQTLLYSQANEASGFPFPNFTFAVTDDANVTRMGVVSFSVSCPPGLVNNVFLSTGPLCIDCPIGAECSQSGIYAPFTQSGYWPSDLNTAASVVYLTCLPSGACVGGSWGLDADSLCSDGYTDRRCGTCADGYYKINGQCSSLPHHRLLLADRHAVRAAHLRRGGAGAAAHLQAQAGGDVLHHRRQLLPTPLHLLHLPTQLALAHAHLLLLRLLHQLQRGRPLPRVPLPRHHVPGEVAGLHPLPRRHRRAHAPLLLRIRRSHGPRLLAARPPVDTARAAAVTPSLISLPRAAPHSLNPLRPVLSSAVAAPHALHLGLPDVPGGRLPLPRTQVIRDAQVHCPA